MAIVTLGIAHFNDIYRVSDQKVHVDGKEETIDVTRFASSLSAVTSKWDDRPDGHKDGLIVFSGDAFSPSLETSVTRGRHMPPIINALGPDVACPGNHEFDLGIPRLNELINDTAFPWLLSNIIDTNTRKVPEPMEEVHVLERKGIRIGFIGLVEKEWIGPITGWPQNYVWHDMIEVGKSLSVKLRDPAGEYKCDVVFAVTHCANWNDIKVARGLGALSPSAQVTQDIASTQGVDLILGGHDHLYWVSKGFTAWENHDLQKPNPNAKDDQGDILAFKSGTDFQDLSEIVLTLRDTPPGSIRKKVIQEIKGKRIVTRGDTPVHAEMKKIVDHELGTINAAMEEKICTTEVELDTRTIFVRAHESAFANWVADCLRHSYDEALIKLGYTKVDGVLSNVGGMRGGLVYEPGQPLTLGDLMSLLPYGDSVMVIEISAAELFGAIENALSLWPLAKGRFPVTSGFRVSWDSRKPAGQRVLGIWLLEETKRLGSDSKPILVDKEEVLRTSTRKYVIMAREYQTLGGDDFVDLKDKKVIISAENGQSLSALVRKFLLGTQFLSKQLREKPETRSGLGTKALDAISGVEDHLRQLHLPHLVPPSALRSIPLFGSILSNVEHLVHDTAETVIHDLAPAVHWLTSTPLGIAAHLLGDHGDMGLLDCYERRRHRILGKEEATVDAADKHAEEHLPAIHPVVDGRLKDVAGAA